VADGSNDLFALPLSHSRCHALDLVLIVSELSSLNLKDPRNAHQ